MAENPQSTPAGTPPEDSRPRPQYGELAPEGWSWTPAPDAVAQPVPAPTRAAEPTKAPAPASVPGTGPLRNRPASAAPAWDRPVTLGLLIFGLLGAFFTIGVLGTLPEALQMLYSQQDLGDYTAAPAVAGLITGGSIAEVVIWLATATLSILFLSRGKRAFYLPLIGGAVGFLVIIVVMSVVLGTDPTLLDVYGRP